GEGEAREDSLVHPLVERVALAQSRSPIDDRPESIPQAIRGTDALEGELVVDASTSPPALPPRPEPADESVRLQPAQQGIDAAVRRADRAAAEHRDPLHEIQAAGGPAAKREEDGGAGGEQRVHRRIISKLEIMYKFVSAPARLAQRD